MDSAELSRKVAEAMGRYECTSIRGADGPMWHLAEQEAENYERGKCRASMGMHLAYPPLDLADARDREAAIAWLRAKGISIQLCYGVAEVYVFIYPKQGWKPLASTKAPTIEEAFGRAFLAAMGRDVTKSDSEARPADSTVTSVAAMGVQG